MCGIVAMLSAERPIDAGALDRSLSALRHRGPDGRGTWISKDRSIALGHVRLAIRDVKGGAQPIANEDRSVIVVVNGELYDFEETRRALEARGHRFQTGSDSEIALHLYEEHGLECFRFLRGEFALVIWDARAGRLVAARDRFGVKPLLYAARNGTLVLASEAKALLAAGVPAVWDEEAFLHAAAMQYTPPDRTLFRDVRQIPPGCFMVARARERAISSYWDADFVRMEDWPETIHDAEIIDDLRARLSGAVEARLRADVPVACALSGGLDSSSVASLAARLSNRPIDCFTVGFEDEAYDERSIAERTARHLGVRFHVVPAKERDLANALPDAIFASESLAVNAHVSAKLLLTRRVAESGCKVLLTGEGADEVLAGYPHFRADAIKATASAGEARGTRERARLDASNRVSAGILLPEGEALDLSSFRARIGFVPTFLEAKASLGYRVTSLLAEPYRSRFFARDFFEELASSLDVAGRLQGRHPVDQASYVWIKLALPSYLLRLFGDGLEMASSIEGRLPFLDHHVFECARKMPISMKIRDGVEKHALREAMRPLLGEDVLGREKHPFFAPPLGTARGGDTGALLQDTLRGRAFASVPFFERAAIDELLDRWPGMSPGERANADPVLMMLTSAAVLAERFRLSSAS